MSEIRPLFACLALSLILHVAILVLPGVRIAHSVAWLGGGSANAALSVTIVSHELAPQKVVQAGTVFFPPNSSDRGVPHSTVVTGDTSSGLRGEEEETPAVELSVDDYLPPSLLEKIPRPVDSVDTDIDFMGMRGVVGEAEIMVLISSEGVVDGVLVMNSTLPGFIVDEAVARFKALTFEAGELQGMKVRSRVRIRLSPPTMDELLGNPYSAKQRAWRR